MSDTTYYRVGQIADKTGKSTRAIRFYEELGLLMPTSRSNSGYRLYNSDSINRVQWIDRLQKLGLSLNEISKVLSVLKKNKTGPELMDALRDFYQQRLEETQKELLRLQGVVNELQSSIDQLDTCDGCSSTSSSNFCKTCDQHDQVLPPMLSAVLD